MIKQFYQSTVTYDKIDEQSGREVTAKEQYLFDAVSYTDAEACTHKEMEPYISGEFDVSKITKTRYSEVIYSPDDNIEIFFKAIVVMVYIDEKSGKESETKIPVLVNAIDIKDALTLIEEKFKDVIVPFRISGCVETPILEVFLRDEPVEEESK